MLAVLAVLLFIEGIWLHVPLARSEAIAALIMATSVLVPVKPLDGESIGRQGLVASAGVVEATVLVALGLI